MLAPVDVAKARLREQPEGRGAVVALLQAGVRPGEVSAVVNFVGGWLSEGFGDADRVNRDLFARSGAFKGAVLSVYGRDDPFYSIGYSRENVAALGRETAFLEVDVPGEGNGHYALFSPPPWAKELDAFLTGIAP